MGNIMEPKFVAIVDKGYGEYAYPEIFNAREQAENFRFADKSDPCKIIVPIRVHELKE